MARKPGKRRFNLRRVRVTASVALGALATLDVTSSAIVNAAADTYRAMSLDASYVWSDKAQIDDACAFGVAHSDYTSAEIEEALEAVTSIDLGDKIAQERSNRLVRHIGTFSGGETPATTGGSSFNDGKPVKTKLNWLMSIGDQLQLWVRNGSGVVYTTGGTITVDGNYWIRDGR